MNRILRCLIKEAGDKVSLIHFSNIITENKIFAGMCKCTFLSRAADIIYSRQNRRVTVARTGGMARSFEQLYVIQIISDCKCMGERYI